MTGTGTGNKTHLITEVPSPSNSSFKNSRGFTYELRVFKKPAGVKPVGVVPLVTQNELIRSSLFAFMKSVFFVFFFPRFIFKLASRRNGGSLTAEPSVQTRIANAKYIPKSGKIDRFASVLVSLRNFVLDKYFDLL